MWWIYSFQPAFILPLLWKQAEKYHCISFFSFVQLICHFCFVITPNVSSISDCDLSFIQRCVSMVVHKSYWTTNKMDKSFQQQSWSFQKKVMETLGWVVGWKHGHFFVLLSSKLESEYEKVHMFACLCWRVAMPCMRCVCRMDSRLGKKKKMDYYNCCSQKSEILSAVGDMKERRSCFFSSSVIYRI